MVRLKFFLFALVVLVAWVAHLKLLAPLNSRAMELAKPRTAAAPIALDQRISQRREKLQRILLAWATHPSAAALAQSLKGLKPETASERLGTFRTELKALLPDELRHTAIAAAVGDSLGALSLGDQGELDGLDAARLATSAGADGTVLDLQGTPYLFVSAPIGGIAFLLGAPLISSESAEQIAGQLDLGAVAVLHQGKVLSVGGSEKASAELLAKNTRPGKPEYVKRGDLGSFGPIGLPLFASSKGSDTPGAPLSVAVRRPTQTPGIEIVSVVSLGSYVAAVSEYQSIALWMLGGLFALSVLVGLLISSGAGDAPQTGATAKSPPESSESFGEAQPLSEANAPASAEPRPSPEEAGVAASGEALFLSGSNKADGAHPAEIYAEAASDGSAEPRTESSVAASGETYTESSSDGYSNGVGEPPPEFEAYATDPPGESLPPPVPADPASTAETGAELGESRALWGGEPAAGFDYNSEATRLAPVPEELIRATAKRPLPPPLPSSPPPLEAEVIAEGDDDEGHFHEVYRDFVDTRRKCGELADGLSYPKFAAKLQKNRDQLIQKYACRTVRFQVYVKDGKAALKATPIRA